MQDDKIYRIRWTGNAERMEEKVNSYDMGAQIFPKSVGHVRMT
jgi:hypothetical protein